MLGAGVSLNKKLVSFLQLTLRTSVTLETFATDLDEIR